VVACCRPRLRFARPSSVDDIAGVAVSRLPARVEEPVFGRRAPRVGGALRCSARVYRGFGALRAPIVPRAPLLTDAGRRAFGLLDGRLLDERLRLAVQVPRLECRRGRDGNGEFPVGECLLIPVPAGRKFPRPRPRESWRGENFLVPVPVAGKIPRRGPRLRN
jgi:hypothetical protein